MCTKTLFILKHKYFIVNYYFFYVYGSIIYADLEFIPAITSTKRTKDIHNYQAIVLGNIVPRWHFLTIFMKKVYHLVKTIQVSSNKLEKCTFLHPIAQFPRFNQHKYVSRVTEQLQKWYSNPHDLWILCNCRLGQMCTSCSTESVQRAFTKDIHEIVTFWKIVCWTVSQNLEWWTYWGIVGSRPWLRARNVLYTV